MHGISGVSNGRGATHHRLAVGGRGGGWLRGRGAGTVHAIAAVLTGMLCSACNPGQLPANASLTVSPASRSVRVHVMRGEQGICLIDPNNYLDIPVQVTLTGPAGDPLAADDLMAFMDFSRETYGGAAVVGMLIDGATPTTVDGNQALLFDVDAGSAVLILRVNLSCPFRGEFTVIQDTRVAGMSVEVIEVNDNP